MNAIIAFLRAYFPFFFAPVHTVEAAIAGITRAVDHLAIVQDIHKAKAEVAAELSSIHAKASFEFEKEADLAGVIRSKLIALVTA